MRFAGLLLTLYRFPVIGQVARQLLFLLGADIPRSVQIGSGLNLKHRGMGVVIHPLTRIGDDVAIFHQVTLGQSEVNESNEFAGIVVEDRAVIGAGAKVLAPAEGLTIARGSVVGANAVLTQSTGPWEVWTGNPATRRGERTLPAGARPKD
jgi:serine O-acetyltransferase